MYHMQVFKCNRTNAELQGYIDLFVNYSPKIDPYNSRVVLKLHGYSSY
jgi:hypothetical protein